MCAALVEHEFKMFQGLLYEYDLKAQKFKKVILNLTYWSPSRKKIYWIINSWFLFDDAVDNPAYLDKSK